MARQVQFFDGATSETTPTIGNIVASNLVKYASDAEYELNEQGAPTEGNIYANTTDNVIRYYDGTEWRTVLFDKVRDDVFHIIGSDDETKEVRFEVDGLTTGTTRVITTVDEDGVMVLEAATQTLTNKTIEVASNTITTAASGNLSSTELNNALAELQSDIDTREVAANKGVANGYASLDGTGLVPAAQLPSYVDDVLEFADLASFPVTGESGKIYVALDTNLTYRWTGSVYVEIASNKVSSVNGQTGIVVLDTDDVSEATNLYYTEARVSANTDVAANTAKVSFPEAPIDGTPYVRQDASWVSDIGSQTLYKKNIMTTADTPSEMDFSNLEAGKTYKLTSHFRISLGSSEDIRVQVTGPDGLVFNSLGPEVQLGAGVAGAVVTTSSVDIFETTLAGDLTFALVVSSGSLLSGSYSILEELPNHLTTTKWD